MKRSMKLRAITTAMALAVLGAVTVGGTALAGSGTGSPTADKNIVETAAADDRFDTLVSLVEQAGLAETLAGAGKFTVFAPTDAAFAKVPKKTLRHSPQTPSS